MIIPGTKATVLFGVAKKYPHFKSLLNFMIPKSPKEKKAWYRRMHDAPQNL